jgi:hypothetical protein
VKIEPFINILLKKIYKKVFAMGTHTISNSSTLQGWLESMGLDDILLNPCACIFGEDEPPPPVPIPGKNVFVVFKSSNSR